MSNFVSKPAFAERDTFHLSFSQPPTKRSTLEGEINAFTEGQLWPSTSPLRPLCVASAMAAMPMRCEVWLPQWFLVPQEIAASPEAIVPSEVMTTSLGSARRPGTESKPELGKSMDEVEVRRFYGCKAVWMLDVCHKVHLTESVCLMEGVEKCLLILCTLSV